MFLVRTGLESASVAARAIGLKRGVPPGNQLRVGLVAGSARQVSTVILWLVRECRVTVVSGNPPLGRVAGVTLLRGAEMVRILTYGIGAVVAGRARSEDLRMIYRDDGLPYGRAVTIFADIRCLNMRRTLTGRLGAVMAINTVGGNVRVIEVRG